MKITTTTVTVDAKTAAKWLAEHNEGNRRLDMATVASYTRDMLEGRWISAADQPLHFDVDGNLLNGQHRLSALVAADIERPGFRLVFTVVTGLAAAARRVFDTHRHRDTGQELALEGWAHGKTLAAVARLLIAWEDGRSSSKGVNRLVVSTPQVAARLAETPDNARASVLRAVEISRSVPLNRSALGAMAWRLFDLARQYDDAYDPEQVHAFLDDLDTGEGLTLGDPVLLLRNRAQRWRIAGTRRGQWETLYLLVRTWNARRRGESLTKFQLPNGATVSPEHLIIL